MNETDQNAVACKVREYLAGRGNGITFEIDDSELLREDQWWRVPIHPTVEPDKRYWYYEILADAEEELSEKEGIKVWLVPGDPLSISFRFRADTSDAQRHAFMEGLRLDRRFHAVGSVGGVADAYFHEQPGALIWVTVSASEDAEAIAREWAEIPIIDADSVRVETARRHQG